MLDIFRSHASREKPYVSNNLQPKMYWQPQSFLAFEKRGACYISHNCTQCNKITQYKVFSTKMEKLTNSTCNAKRTYLVHCKRVQVFVLVKTLCVKRELYHSEKTHMQQTLVKKAYQRNSTSLMEFTSKRNVRGGLVHNESVFCSQLDKQGLPRWFGRWFGLGGRELHPTAKACN